MRSILALALEMLLCIVLAGTATARRFEVLHVFTGGRRLGSPNTGLVADSLGNVYGSGFGRTCCGDVYTIEPSGKVSVLYAFQGIDGNRPGGRLLVHDGDIFGTTVGGGVNFDNGTVFRLTPTGRERVLYSFCSRGRNCRDGRYPSSGLVADSVGNFYGSAASGLDGGESIVFRVTPTGKEKLLYAFCREAPSCPDGGGYIPSLMVDAAGNLYGTTGYGGASGAGTVFRISHDGMENVLYSFCEQSNAQVSCADGSGPAGGVLADDHGNLYGTTEYGGAYGGGVVFKLAPDGSETVLHSFNGPDGIRPTVGLSSDGRGNFYGTTSDNDSGGGKHCAPPLVVNRTPCGTVFRVASDGTSFSTLHAFCSWRNCADGAYPVFELLQQGSLLYGVTALGGIPTQCGNDPLAPLGCGTIFRIRLDRDSAR